MDEYIKLKKIPVKGNKLTLESDISNEAVILEWHNTVDAIQEKSKESSDEAMHLDHNGNTYIDSDTYAYSSVSSTSEVELEGNPPRILNNVRCYLTHYARMESEESTRNDNDDEGVEDYARQHISKDKTDKKKALTTSKHLEDLQHKANLTYQEMFQGTPRSTIQLLSNHSKLWEASVQLTKEIK